MSRNFELLRKAGREEVLLGRTSSHSPREASLEPISNGHSRPHPPGHGEAETLKLVQELFLFANSHAPRAVVFSSVQANGSSEICWRTGAVLAAQGCGSVCLVDGNLHSPVLHQLAGIRQFPGLTEATAKPGAIRDFAVGLAGGPWLVPAGSYPKENRQMFASDRLRSRIKELREEFAYVLIDTAPISSTRDAVLLGQMTEGVVLVLEANTTRKETARLAKETLESANVRLLGAVLNNRTYPIPEALYRKL
jgi:Mrp family chromosome partitioning ATPase